uniref:ER lumen protein-retaining receptor n=1 Tax=Cryptomonas curvata TaxID=233186 RepID=A0A7S0MN64_9CRYP|mmetsp:Transcript_49187/g.102636  ORF Transcript_49187/g.102636 Transcript_49187/m.102636 type:complete len:312 (+) Transcript_49187:133-1068(+)|eukprot:CAMPEP_0172174796 /NCGR_PEP_ID=MMETSP1050-20130122/13869_1 /TAXON_ID=233186 /ORGANISM="Cryptomonas curvata, Strain CCAP979/52" /LENGTH=311 /DNA_ID=CAMNT_0012846823 /DNA_START=177 /DNA_END=1112 /DNA_ORIENTATION=+
MSEHDKDFKTVVKMKLANLHRVLLTVFEEKVQPMLRKLSKGGGFQQYGAFVLVITVLLWYMFAHDFLYLVSMLAEMLRTFGIVLLCLRVVKKTQSVQGLSLKTQQLYAIVFGTRLLFKLSYEEDYLYAAVELTAFALTCFLVYLMRVPYAASYQSENDTFKDAYILVPCLALAIMLHPTVTGSWFINVLWAFSTYLESVALLPQLFVFHSASRTVDNMTSLWIVSLFLSRILECSFWFIALFFRGYMRIWSSIVWYVVLTELVHTLLLLDFVRNFYKCYKQGMSMLLPSAWGMGGGKESTPFSAPGSGRID